MGSITDDMREAFRRHGFVVVPGVLDPGRLRLGRRMVEGMLAKQPPPVGHNGPHVLLRPFTAQGHPLLDLYRETGIAGLAAQLLRAGLPPADPEDVQVATTVPPWPRTRLGPSVEGLDPTEPGGRPGTFSLLAGVWLTDQSVPSRATTWIWPGSHLRLGVYLAEQGADALTRTEDMAPGPYPRIDLGEPVQAVGPAGSVLFTHYLLAHTSDGQEAAGEERQETLSYRLRAAGHRERWRTAVTEPLTEFAP